MTVTGLAATPPARTRSGVTPSADALSGGSGDEPLPVLGADVRVPLATGGTAEYAALDQAASASCLRSVWDDVAAYLPWYGSVHRGAGHLSRLSTRLYETSRATVARHLGTRPGDTVVFTRGTTDSLNLLAACLPEGTRVFVFETEHHAALLPWRRAAAVTRLPAPESPDGAVAALDAALARAPRGPRLVCVTGASNVTGELFPVAAIAAVARRHGARVVLDAAQLAPHHPVSVAGLGVDWVALSGHKLYAPFGAGVLAGRADWLDAAEPYLAGGGASRSVDGDRVTWHDGPARHEAGSPNVVGAYAIARAFTALAEAGRERLAAREASLLREVRRALGDLGRVRTLELFGPESARVAVLSFVVEGCEASRFAAALSDEYGIGVRDGLFCAHTLVRRLLGGTPGGPGADAGAGRGGTADGGGDLAAVRVSFGAGTPAVHLERFADATAELLRRRV